MKKSLLLLFFITGFAQAQIINFPDANFKAKLLSADTSNQIAATQFNGGSPSNFVKLDANSDGEIDQGEAATIKYLDLESANITNLTGIVYFIDIRWLRCGNNQITSIDFTGMMSLEYINCQNNLINSLNFTGLSNVLNIYCPDNQLSTLNVLGLNTLEVLNCTTNQLTTLDFTGLQGLQWVFCANNQLTSLDFHTNPNFFLLGCANNNLYNIDLKNGRQQACAVGIGSSDNWDVGNPNLTFICVDENEAVDVENFVTGGFSGPANPLVTTYCTFTPGGDYNTITGSILFDGDNDGCDASDVAQPFVKLTIDDGTNEGATFDDLNGNYTFYTLDGTFTVTPDIENPTWFNFSPVDATVNFPVVDNSVSTQNFCITANGIHPDVEIVIAPIGRAVPGFDAKYQIVYKNKGNQLLSGDVNFTYDDTRLDIVSATVIPDLQSTGSLSWNYTNLRPFENRTIYVTLHVNSPTDTPPLNSGDILDFTATVNPIAGDEIPADNVFDFHQTVVNSYDPNDKTCIEGGIVSPTQIGGYLHYLINFENIGTAEAVNVVVKDVIDESKFDVKSLQIMNSSDPVEAKVTGNVAEFIFKGIRLRGGGHGNILLKIKTKDDLQVGDVVSNKADIFFDYNFPIETNVANTTFQTLSNNDFAIDQSVSIYPNPSKGNVAVKANGIIKTVQLFDIQGRILETKITNEKELNMDISKYTNGVYFLKVLTDVGIKTEKLIKD